MAEPSKDPKQPTESKLTPGDSTESPIAGALDESGYQKILSEFIHINLLENWGEYTDDSDSLTETSGDLSDPLPVTQEDIEQANRLGELSASTPLPPVPEEDAVTTAMEVDDVVVEAPVATYPLEAMTSRQASATAEASGMDLSSLPALPPSPPPPPPRTYPQIEGTVNSTGGPNWDPSNSNLQYHERLQIIMHPGTYCEMCRQYVCHLDHHHLSHSDGVDDATRDRQAHQSNLLQQSRAEGREEGYRSGQSDQRDITEGELRQLRQQVQSLTEQNSNLSGRVSALKAQLGASATQEQDYGRIREDLRRLEESNKRKSAQVSQSAKLASKNDEELKALHKRVNEVSSRLEESLADSRRLAARNRELQEQSDRLQHDLSWMRPAYDSLRREYDKERRINHPDAAFSDSDDSYEGYPKGAHSFAPPKDSGSTDPVVTEEQDEDMDKQVHEAEGAGAIAPTTSSSTTAGPNAPVVRLPPRSPPTAGPSRLTRIDDSDDEGEGSGPDNEVLAGLGWMTTPGMPGSTDSGRRRARRSRQRQNRSRREAELMARMPPPANAPAAPNPAPSSSSDTSGKRKRDDEEGQQGERDWTRGSLRSERDYEEVIIASEGGNDSATRRLIMEDNNLRCVQPERLSLGQRRFLQWSSQRDLRAPRHASSSGEVGAPSRQKKSRTEGSAPNARSESQSATRTIADLPRPRAQRSRAPPPALPQPGSNASDREWAEYWNHPGVTMPQGALIISGEIDLRWVRQYRWLESIAPGAASNSPEDMLVARQDANAFRRYTMTVASVPGNLEAQWAYHSLQSVVPTGTTTPRLDHSLIGNERAMLRHLRLVITSAGQLHELERWARTRRNNLLGRPGLSDADFPQAPNRASLEETWAQARDRGLAQEAQPSASWFSQSAAEVQMQPPPPRSPASEAQMQPPAHQPQQWPQPPQQQQQWQPPQPTLTWQQPVQQQQWAPYGSTSTQWGQLTSFAQQPGSQGNVPPAGGFTYPAPAPQPSYPYYQGWPREQSSQSYAYPPSGPNQWPQPSGSGIPAAPQNAGAPLSSAVPQPAPTHPTIYSFGQFGPAGAALGPQSGAQAEADPSSFPPSPPFGPPPPGPPGPAPPS
ncbi:uncharacterized protein STEHIDRAFT_164079 [Stereum hirsutum FP-91666 SS1]|uniref:Uncharacterized protein n=1 Tax=Stereum hirsutum (strain FP-91666) TaxID=721885 RepID=R7RXE9_STEHR|nr:uncharacterized protein STEHIDRAFT_153247 [Stereum hirsutum FP-91666 SS1]XP_007302703.1 uncharacterized protein STEHIDRAFT_155351 [Stereum hirsutum FP-91666 SS1]XP_007311871.1 uncharacterized protein STEHIDRAFT_164079 [Stereum hirsutum FP-91666 SS1]EIM79032.1 hypothetical protein STEHIDRAFT_164079 [Stereum hirsutum FP-91666 SS1]EIM87992.1 hypothetical protein STEHIDRAFT_155351 [Stereum hirsutum FP-91666 SS1]EIM91620.1 hypothetical protein STEHIDRAFT_153247 [Stereum hirsutum FP-91666 SS1]